MKALRSLFQFTTILPFGKSQDLEYFARKSYLYPVAGYLLGFIAALPVFFIVDRMIAAAVAIALIHLITGGHHYDGLLDFGDGLMAHGNRERRIRALTDRNIGAGAIALGISVTLLAFAGLQGSPSIIIAIIAGEVCAKFSMSFLTTFGIPFREGVHSYLHQYSKSYFPFISLLICIPLVLVPIAPVKIFGAFLSMLICPVILLLVSNKIFGGVNGDVVGASNEITRALVILAIAIL